MRIAPFLAILPIVAFVAGCAPKIPSEMAGSWTPRSINDCSDNGQTFEFASDGGYVRDRGVRQKIMKFISIKHDEKDTVDVMFNLRDYDSKEEKYEEARGFRFKQLSPDELKLIAGSDANGVFGHIGPQALLDRFDLIRCPSS